jgi:hypothetical protein
MDTTEPNKLSLDSIQEEVARILAEPKSVMLKERLQREWDAVPAFNLPIDASADAVAEKAIELGDYASNIFDIEPPPLAGVQFIMGEVAKNLVTVKEYIAFMQELENPGKACNIFTDSHVMIKALVLFMAIHILVAYASKNDPDRLDEEKGGISAFRLFSVASNVISMSLMEHSTLTFVDKSELAEKEANTRKIILPHEA